jgi:hypothetical protein
MKKKLFIGMAVVGVLVIFLGTAGVALASLASGPDQPYNVYVTVKEFKVMVDSPIIPANVPIRFVVKNQGVLTHEVVMEKLGDDDVSLEGVEVQPEAGGENHAEIEKVSSNENKSDIWLIKDPGSYQLACHVTGHYSAGMVTPITVVGASLFSPALLLIVEKVIHSWFILVGSGLIVLGILGFAGFAVYQKKKKQKSTTQLTSV